MDRISNLPSDVIDDIIKSLTLHDAARTCILSRGWRYKWLSIPYLVFYQNFQEKLHGKYTVASIIYQVLLFHKGSIVKFVFNASIKGTKMISCLADEDNWLRFLSTHPIEVLSLEFSNQAIQKVPNHLFSFGEVKHLKLANCNLKPPSSFKGFGRLGLLNLCNVTIEYSELKSFISKCPLLEHLTLSGDTLPCLRIHAPNLKSFNLDVRSECPRVCLKNTSFLEEVTIFISLDTLSAAWFEMNEDSCISLIFFLSQLTSVKKLELSHDTLLFLSCSDFPSNIPDETLGHLSRLICHFSFEEPTVVECVVRLIVRSTNLHRLHIIADSDVKDDHSVTMEYLHKEKELKHSMCHLKHVKIDNFSGIGSEMEFVKMILLAATSLVTLELELRPYLEAPSQIGHETFRSLLSFPRSSANAQIII